MDRCELETVLEPVVAALAPTSFGRPKTQAVITENLDAFLAMRRYGLTLQAIAEGLNIRGARTKNAGLFTAASLGSMIDRAAAKTQKRAAAATWTGTRARAAKPPAAKENRIENPLLGVFAERIGEVMAQKAADEILSRGRRR